MDRKFILFLMILLICLPVTAIVIKGHNREYSGMELSFFRYSDPVTKYKIPVFSLKVDQKGNFKTEVAINKPTYVFCDFGIYRGMILIDPENNIELLLPPLREKTFADEKNPYFEPVNFWFSTGSGDHLNDSLAVFDTKFYQLTGKYFNQLYFRQSRISFDSLITNIEHYYKNKASETLRLHAQLKLKSVEMDAFRLPPDEASQLISSVDPGYWEHPAFIELIENTFANRLSFEVKTVKSGKIREAVNKKDTEYLIQFIIENYKLTGDVARLALLKMLYDGFYSGDFSEEAILKIVDSEQFRKNKIEKIQEIAKNVARKLKFLRKGTIAPVICLKNTDGHNTCTDSNNDKFKYMVFADIEMIICREHLKYLTEIHNKFKKHLEIIIILKKNDLIEMKMFLNKLQIPGIHLIDENKRYIEEYRIRSFPYCLLLDKDHKVVLQQTKAPLNGFEQQFATILQKKRGYSE